MSKLLKYSDFITEYNRYSEKHVHEFLKFSTSQSKLSQELIEPLAKVLFNESIRYDDNFPVISLRMGLGKTTFIQLYTQYLLNINPEYRSVIAVERIEDIQRICEKDSHYYGLYGFRKEDCLAGFSFYNPNNCRFCEYEKCRILQNEEQIQLHRIIVTTHSRLHIALQVQPIMNQLLYYYDNEGNKRRRQDLFIDESPTFYKTECVTDKDILSFQKALHSTYRRDCQSRRELLEYFSPYIKKRRSELKSREIYYIQRLTREEIVRFDKYQDIFLRNYYGGMFNTCLNVMHTLKYGGIRQSQHIVTPTFNQLSVGDFRKGFVFDGTAAIDNTYPQNMLIIDFDDYRSFENTILHVHTQHNLSKTYYDDHPQFIPEIVEEILSQLNYHEKILIVTFKEQEDVYRSYLHDKGLDQRIFLEHFNNLKGKNQYRDATCVFILGSIYKGDEYYGLFVNEDLTNIEFVNLKKKRLAYYKDSGKPCKAINDFIIKDSVKDIAQMFFRGSPRDNPELKADLFFFSTNNDIVYSVLDFFNNAKLIESWLEEVTQEYDHFIKSISAEFNNEVSHAIKKSDFCEKYSISRQSLTNYLKKESTKALIEHLKLTIRRYNIAKD